MKIFADLNEKVSNLNFSLSEIKDITLYDKKKKELFIIENELKNPDLWKNYKKTTIISKRISFLKNFLFKFDNLFFKLNEIIDLINCAKDEMDLDFVKSLDLEVNILEKDIEKFKYNSLFCGKFDFNNAFIDIKPGSGGIDAQDWGSILLRMYIKCSEKLGFKANIVDYSDGNIAGLKSASLKISGDYAFGWFNKESGVHRMVRKSPFDVGNKRHTSFSSVFVYPEIKSNLDFNILPSDIKVDTYKSSGAGGQHVNKTDSAVRITYIPYNLVVQSQSSRSQHRNKIEAMNRLKSKVYKLKKMKFDSSQIQSNKKNSINWGNQIRSYVLDKSIIKDLRSGIEVKNVYSVLNGDLYLFLKGNFKLPTF